MAFPRLDRIQKLQEDLGEIGRDGEWEEGRIVITAAVERALVVV